MIESELLTWCETPIPHTAFFLLLYCHSLLVPLSLYMRTSISFSKNLILVRSEKFKIIIHVENTNFSNHINSFVWITDVFGFSNT